MSDSSGQACPGPRFLVGGGEMGALMRQMQWSQTPLGSAEAWPHSLQVVVRILLTSRYAMWMGWGRELTFFYNDAYRPTLGVKHPQALGKSAREVWAEIWPDIGPRAEAVVRDGVATWDEGLLLFLERSGYPEETYHTFSYSPIPDDRGGVGGMLCVVTEETERVIGERRLASLRDLASQIAATKTEAELTSTVEASIARYAKDLPFALLYLFDDDGKRATLACACGILPEHPAAPKSIATDDATAAWPVALVLGRANSAIVEDLPARFGALPMGAWDKLPRQAVLVPIAHQGQSRPAGLLIAAVNPYRQLDAAYLGFLELLGGQIASGLANVRAYEAERRRAEGLAELDRAKTTVFATVSHEFRTPLTLMLGPLEDLLLTSDGRLPPEHLESLAVVQRNGHRLLKLVNTLLDFSRIEAGRVRATYQPTDLASFTSELASVFRSAVERAGMRLEIDCPALPEHIYVDREMWEKIVLNLVSNAFKYTLAGDITVRLGMTEKGVKLTVTDTGTGIPEAELPNLFNRFHRVEGVRGRTHEGTGIGLALVQELVKLHGGCVGVESRFGHGSTFSVEIPRGSQHLPAERIKGERTLSSTAVGASGFVEEALRWLPGPASDELPRSGYAMTAALGASADDRDSERPRVLLVDDNADMREYVRRLLAEHYDVLCVPDGVEALQAAHEHTPDLVLTDVMMPNLDGFGLLRALRADAGTKTIPVIMLSARAGEEARVEGLDAGADDYLIKPFSARELLARVAGTLALARARREALRREEELRAETTSVLESISEGFLALDRQFRITYMNAEAERLNRVPRSELMGKNYWDVFPATRGTKVESEYRRAVVERIAARFEYHYEPWNKWLEIDVYPATDGGLAVYFRDITDRKHKSEQLQALASAAVLVNSNLSIPDTLQVVTDRARAIIGVHQAITVFVPELKWSRAIQARSLTEKYAAWRAHDTGVRGLALYRLVCDTNRPVRLSASQLEAQPHWAASDLVAAQLPPMRGWLSAPLVGRDGRNLGLIQLSDKEDGGDFTEQDEAILVQLAQTASVAVTNATLYQTTQEARAEAESANRMKDQFLATLSHELRTPLNAILGWARILQSGRIDEAALREGLETIERNSRVQAQLIEDLLDLSRIISGKMRLDVQRVALTDVIEAALASIRPAADAKDIRLHTVLDPLAGPVSGDPGRLQQVVWNLLSNAVKFTPRGGRIQVVLERVNSHVEICVIDTGQGVKPEFLPYVFDRFRQADASTTRRQGGLGLGLSIVKQLVEMHGGGLRAKSPGEGKGATFTISLPIMALHDSHESRRIEPKPATDQELEEPVAPLEGVRVLGVDDEHDARELIRRILADCRAEVRVAGSVPEALSALRHFGPHLLLSDIGMPDQDGFELIRQVRASGVTAKTVPAVALTAFARAEDRRRALLAGFQVHVAKPVDPAELVATIASLLGRTGGAA